MKTARQYVMRARADAADETARRILAGTVELVSEKLTLEITLEDVAQRAAVSVRTVLRHFGNREGLFDSAEAFAEERVLEERAAPVGDVALAVRGLFRHYEKRGNATLRVLGQEPWSESARRMADTGRRTHRQWVARAFAPQLGLEPEAGREELLDLLVVATDLYTWKLLRRDRGLPRRQAEERVRRLISALFKEEGS